MPILYTPLYTLSTLLFRLYIKKAPKFGAFSLFAFWLDVWPNNRYNVFDRFGRFHLVTQRIEGVICFRLLVAANKQYAFKVGLRQHHPYTVTFFVLDPKALLSFYLSYAIGRIEFINIRGRAVEVKCPVALLVLRWLITQELINPVQLVKLDALRFCQ